MQKVQQYLGDKDHLLKFNFDHSCKIFLTQSALKSGGYIIIDQTEALVAIDVNSEDQHERTIEDTALKITHYEEFARQARLRDLSGHGR